MAHEARSVGSLLTVTTQGVRLEGDAPCRTEAGLMDFPLKDYMDEGACYRRLVELLHPGGLACPRCGQGQHLGIHSRQGVIPKCGHAALRLACFRVDGCGRSSSSSTSAFNSARQAGGSHCHSSRRSRAMASRVCSTLSSHRPETTAARS